MTRLMTLSEMYYKKLKASKNTGEKPNLSLLLILLLFPNIEELRSKMQGGYADVTSFYRENKAKIDTCIEKITKDYELTKEQLAPDTFKDALAKLVEILNTFPYINNPETTYQLLHKQFGGEPLTRVIDSEIPYSEMSPLQRRYSQYLNEFNPDKKRPHPAILLALLILEDKEEYIYQRKEYGDEGLKTYIDDKIKQVMTDFEITELSLFVNYPIQPGQIGIQDKVGILYNERIKENVFGKALTIISKALSLAPDSSPEMLYSGFCYLFNEDNVTDNFIVDYFMQPQVRYNPETMMYQYPKLDDLYAYYLNIYDKTKKHPHPSELLALLLLQEKERYFPTNGTNGQFYQWHKESIESKIEQVCTDFDITKEKIIEYIEEAGIVYEEENYERDRIYTVFCHGFSVVQGSNMYTPSWSPEKIHNSYSEYWGRKPIPDELIENPLEPRKANTRLITLQERYHECLEKNKNGEYELDLSELLALLIFSHLDEVDAVFNFEGFYNSNRTLLESLIDQIMDDFDISEDKLKDYYNLNDYEELDTVTIRCRLFSRAIVATSMAKQYFNGESPETIYNKLASIHCCAPLPKVNDESPQKLCGPKPDIEVKKPMSEKNIEAVPDSKKSKLQTMYDQYVFMFKIYNRVPRLDMLLALLLLSRKQEILQQKDDTLQIEPKTSYDFYEANQGIIEECIEKIKRDFTINKRNLFSIYKKLLEKGKMAEITYNGEVSDLERYWFFQGIDMVFDALAVHPYATSEALYNHYCYRFGEVPEERFYGLEENCWIAGVKPYNQPSAQGPKKRSRTRKPNLPGFKTGIKIK